MAKSSGILSTVRMLQQENLDLRTVTMGINISGCARSKPEETAEAVEEKIRREARKLVPVCNELSDKYGLPVVNKRLAVSPASSLLEGCTPEDALTLAQAMESAAAEVDIDLIGGFAAMAEKGMTPGERLLIDALPLVLSNTSRVCASLNVASSQVGINVDASYQVAETLLQMADTTTEERGFACAKLNVFTNAPDNNPFMAGAFHGKGQPESVINVGVSGPGVVKRAVDRLLEEDTNSSLDKIAEEIKHTAYRITRTGELIGREVADALDVTFGIVDLSLAPTPRVGDSVGEIYHSMGLEKLGSPGTTAAVALVNDAVKKGGAFASSAPGGLSGAFIPVLEDHAMAKAVEMKHMSIEKLEAMTSVCAVGLDMVLLPGDTSVDTLCGLILDELAIGTFNNKTCAVRLIPVPGARAGDRVNFGGLFGHGAVANVNCPKGSTAFVGRGGQIPPPLQSLRT